MHLMNGLMQQEAASSWEFDMMSLDVATGGHALSCFGFWLLQVWPEQHCSRHLAFVQYARLYRLQIWQQQITICGLGNVANGRA